MSGPRRILSDAQIEQMIALRERGWSPKRIAEHFTAAGTKISIGSVAWQCLRVGADAPPPLRSSYTPPPTYQRNGRIVRAFTPDEDAILREMDWRGASPSDMARRLGRQPNSIRGRLYTIARHEARAEEPAIG